MGDVLQLLTKTLPPQLLAPVAAVLVTLLLWPTLRDVWQSTIPSHRTYTREKRRLELLKLTVEIEALRKQHGLETMGGASEEVYYPVDVPIPKQSQQLSNHWRMLYGTVGGALVVIPLMSISLYFAAQFGTLQGGMGWAIVISGVFVLCGAGGLVALFTRTGTRQKAMITGALAIVVLMGLAFFVS
jgi:hypothetical protein